MILSQAMRQKRGVGKSQENKGQKTKEIQVTKRLGYIGEGIEGREGHPSPWAGEI